MLDLQGQDIYEEDYVTACDGRYVHVNVVRPLIDVIETML